MRETKTALGSGLLPVEVAKRREPGFDEQTIQNAATATGADPNRIRSALRELNESGAAGGSYTFRGPKGEGTIFWQRARS